MHARVLFFWIWVIVWVPRALADPYPNTLWSSERIPHTLVGVKVGHVLPDPGQDIVVLSQDRLVLYRKILDKIYPIKELESHGEKWIKLSLFDLDQDGNDEVVVSGLANGRARTRIFKIIRNEFKQIDLKDYYTTVIYLDGLRQCVAQSQVGGEDFTGPLKRLVWENGGLIEKGTVPMPGGVSGESFSLFSVQGIPGGLVHLSPGGYLQHYTKAKSYKKVWQSGAVYGGSVISINREVTNALNEVEGKRFMVPAPMAWTPRGDVVVVKNEGYLKQVIGVVPAIQNSQLVRLAKTEFGFQEVWSSSRYDGAISDFDFIDWDQDGDQEVVVSFLLRDRGYVDTLKKQDSLLLVVDSQ